MFISENKRRSCNWARSEAFLIPLDMAHNAGGDTAQLKRRRNMKRFAVLMLTLTFVVVASDSQSRQYLSAFFKQNISNVDNRDACPGLQTLLFSLPSPGRGSG